MDNEGQFNANLSITNGKLIVQRSFSFPFNQSTAKGSTPGNVAATVAGTVVSLAALTYPGVGYITNLDTTNYVQVGIYSSALGTFFPLMDVWAGETWPIRFSSRLGHGESGSSGTGTGGVGSDSLMIKGVGGTVNCDVQIFEK